jgi:hypothetical protein
MQRMISAKKEKKKLEFEKSYTSFFFLKETKTDSTFKKKKEIAK